MDGTRLSGLKDYKNSIDYYQKHIDKASQDFGEDWVEPYAFLNLGVAYLKNQQYELAKEQLTKALKYYNGQSAESKYYWAVYENHKGHQDKALKWMNESIEDFLVGYSKNRPYNEEIGQMYLEQLKAFKYKLLNKKPLLYGGANLHHLKRLFTPFRNRCFIHNDIVFVTGFFGQFQ